MAELDPTYPQYLDKGYKLKYPPRWKDAGDYVPGRSYKVKDVVRCIGSVFESKRNNNTQAPATYDKATGVVYFNTEYWDILINNTGEYILHGGINDVQDEINVVAASDSEITLEINPTIIFSGESSIVYIRSYVKTVGNISSHNISKNSQVITSGTSATLNYTDTVNTTSNVNYTSTTVVNGKQIQKSVTLIIVGKIYYGSGRNSSDANIADNTPKETPNGTYNIDVRNNGDNVFIDIPNSMSVNAIKVNGFILPYVKVSSSRSGYTCYKSTNTYDSGRLVIEIS